MIEGPPINISRLIEGDENVFQALFIDYYPSLISFAIKYVDREEVAEDIVQDVFVKVWETREKLREVDNLSAYLYQMVRFRCFNHLRAEKIRHDATRSFTEEMDIMEMNEFIKEETFRIVMHVIDQFMEWTIPTLLLMISSFFQAPGKKLLIISLPWMLNKYIVCENVG